MELVPTRSMGAISWRLGVGLIASKLASTWASAWRRSELARDPGVELRLNQVTVMGRIAVWAREGYTLISNFR